MTNNTILIICLLIVVAVLVGIILRGRNQHNGEDAGTNELGIVPSGQTAIKVADVYGIALQNSLGEEIRFNRPNELTEAKYQEVSISGTGKVVQHAGQGAGNIYTLQQLGNLANTELYTHPRARDFLHVYEDSTYSTVIWGENGKIVTHEGFEAFDATKVLTGVNPALITMVAMQGMAIVSGQYFLKQINSSLQAIGRDIQELKEIHEAEKRGTLTHCRNRLMEIAQKEYCTQVDINEIRSLANDAGKILEEYKDRYYTAKKEAEKYWFSHGTVNKAIDEYNNRLYKMRYLLQVCMVADRIIDEARLTEFVVLSKMDINSPELHDAYRLMEEHYRNGFNAHIIEDADNISDYMINKAWGIVNDSASPYRNIHLIDKVKSNMDGMQEEIFDLTSSVRRIQENREKMENVAILLSDKEEPRFFIELEPEEVDEETE